MLLIFGAMFASFAAQETQTHSFIKDVSLVQSISLDSQITSFDIVYHNDLVLCMQNESESYLIKEETKRLDVNLQSEGLLNFKYPLINSNLYYNYFSLKTNEIRLAKTSDTMIVLSYKYPFLC